MSEQNTSPTMSELEDVLKSVKKYLSDTETLISKMPNSIKAASLLYGVNRALDLIDGLNLSNSTPLNPAPVAKQIVWDMRSEAILKGGKE